jgi:hypothetical protein
MGEPLRQREQTWDVLADVLDHITYTRDEKPGHPRFRLVRDDAANYAVLHVFTHTPNTYRPDETRHTRHEFIVPAATYHREGWTRWVFDRLCSIELHETCESFQVDEGDCAEHCTCKTCGCAISHHDGRDSTCYGPVCPDPKHRFSCSTNHYVRPYSPHHGNGWDPYTLWLRSSPAEQAKAPGDD